MDTSSWWSRFGHIMSYFGSFLAKSHIWAVVSYFQLETSDWMAGSLACNSLSKAKSLKPAILEPWKFQFPSVGNDDPPVIMGKTRT